MAILEDENRALRRRVREIEMDLRHLQEAHAHIMSENAQLKERVNALTLRLEPEGSVEERKFPRIFTTLRVDSMNRRGAASMGIARNVSLGGAFIETDLSLSMREMLTLVVEIDGQPLKIQAEVVRIENSGYGVQFLLDANQRKTLEVHILRLE